MKRDPAESRMRGELDEHSRFESLLIDLSARFVNLRADQVDGAIEDAQRRICEALQFDTSLLWQWTNQPSARLRLTHIHRPLGGPRTPEQSDVRLVFPWAYARVLAGHMYMNATLDDLPPEAGIDKATLEHYGVKSNIGLPLVVGGGTPLGVLAFNTVREHRAWTEAVVKRLQLVAQIFANALARKQADAEARLRLRQLAHLNRVATMGELTTALAHELNQPLGAILRNTEAAELLLRRETPDLQELRAIVADIRRDDERASGVIDRLRSLLRQRDVDLRPTGLAKLTDEVLRVALVDATARGIRLASEVPAGLPEVRCDCVHVQQVLLNLIMNGMDALGDVAEGAPRVIVVRARPTGDGQVEVSVADTGTGILAEDSARVFEPFYTTKGGGMGMGLAISRTLVEAQGGRLWVGPGGAGADAGAGVGADDGRGASLHFTLPIATPDEGRS